MHNEMSLSITILLLKILRKEDGPILIDSIGGFVMESINQENKE